MSASATRAEIERYSDQVLRNTIPCDLPSCFVCDTLADHFRRHEARRRTFRILCGELVERVLGLVMRLKCPGCGKTFTQYPPFALPFKRYTRQTIMSFSDSYLQEEALSYRNAVLNGGMPFFYGSGIREGDAIDDRALAHSTLYRWISSLSGFKEILRSAQDIILQKNPVSAICRRLAALKVSLAKYVKDHREPLLKRALQLLHLEVEYRATFTVSIFPCFATRCRWG
jgi:Domain of unknown function (DUF6431)